MVKFVYGFLPSFVSYTDNIDEKNGGETKFMFIKIRPKYKDDKGLLEHELVHVRQCYRMLIIFHGIFYRFSQRYRLNAEVEAYAKQIKCNRDEGKLDYIDFYVDRICTCYDLDVTRDSVKTMLERKIMEA